MEVFNPIDEMLETKTDVEVIENLHRLFKLQKKAFLQNPNPSAKQRIELMAAVPEMLRAYRNDILDALNEDFGGHSTQQGDLIEILGMFERAKYNIANVEKWMKPQARELNFITMGSSKAYVKSHPKGVIGNMVSWNFPFDIACGPMLDQLGAGNRVILKPSNLSPNCGKLLQEMIAKTFDPAQVAVVNGGLALAKHFPTLPWDHLVFTGSGNIGKQVMKAAAENLVPVTLELGGKNPVIVHEDSVNSPDMSAEIIGVKFVKRGQMCVTPDYCLVPEKSLDVFVKNLEQTLNENFAQNNASAHATGIINHHHQVRLEQMIEEALDEDVTVIKIGKSTKKGERNMPFYVVVNPPDHLRLMRQEVFGPILPIKTYKNPQEIIDYIQKGDKPLGLYIYSKNQDFVNLITENTESGGISVNAPAMQAALPSLPFGGVGGSGMGVHHGEEGFREFSNQRGYFIKGKGGVFKTIMPPYTQETDNFIENVGYASPLKQLKFALKQLPKNIMAILFG
jgi:coniferyl-aldehyde dehydrogenase